MPPVFIPKRCFASEDLSKRKATWAPGTTTVEPILRADDTECLPREFHFCISLGMALRARSASVIFSEAQDQRYLKSISLMRLS